jgi:hypothetical protein
MICLVFILKRYLLVLNVSLIIPVTYFVIKIADAFFNKKKKIGLKKKFIAMPMQIVKWGVGMDLFVYFTIVNIVVFIIKTIGTLFRQ